MAGQRTVGCSGWARRWVRPVLLCLVLVATVARAKEDAGSQWVSAYGWIQTGDKLAASKLWPLAIGSYIEADRQIKILAEEHPDYEPDVVAYRLEKLEEDIEAAQGELTTGEHDIMMKYLDFIESYELGKKQRFENKFEDSLTTLSEARSILDELIEEKPDEFEEAVKTQHELLDNSIDWLYSQVSFKRQASRVVSVGDGYDWGTTKYVKESDLPSSKFPVEPSGSLFPNVPAVGAPAAASPMNDDTDEPKGDSEMDGDGDAESKEEGPVRPFRMNSRSKPAGVGKTEVDSE